MTKKIRAKVHLKSGAVVIIHADRFERNDIGNDLHTLTADGAVDYPLYLRLDDISAIVTERRTLFGWKRF